MAKKKGSETAAEVYAELADQGKGVVNKVEPEISISISGDATRFMTDAGEAMSPDARRIAELEAKLRRAEERLQSSGTTTGEATNLRPITFDPNDTDPKLDEPVLGPGITHIRGKTGIGAAGGEIRVPTWRELRVHPRDVDEGPKYDGDGRRLPCRFIKQATGNLVEWR